MYKFGTVVLIPFSFTDLTSAKVRPAVILSKGVFGQDVIVAFLSSKGGNFKNSWKISEKDPFFGKTGLKVASRLRFDKLATLHKGLILGEMGFIPSKYLKEKADVFRGVFGF